MSAGRPRDGEMQLVAAVDKQTAALPPRPPSTASNAIVAYEKPLLQEDEEDLEIKLRRIIDNVPVRVSNTSGSSAGSGSGDFHQYRQMRRKEQDRVARMEADYERRKEIAEFNIRREEKLKAAEERTAKKRLKRQKKKQRKKQTKVNTGGENQEKESSDDSDNDGGSNRINEVPKEVRQHLFVKP